MNLIDRINIGSNEGYIAFLVLVLFVFACIYLFRFILRRNLLYEEAGRVRINERTGLQYKKLGFRHALHRVKYRLRKDKIAALFHDLVMFGFLIFTITVIVSIIQVALKLFWGITFLKGTVGIFYSILSEVSAIAVFIGLLAMVYIRLSGGVRRLEKSSKHLLPLLAFILVLITFFVYQGFEASVYGKNEAVVLSGLPIALILNNISVDKDLIESLYIYSWFCSMFFFLMFLVLITRTKLYHMIAGIMTITSLEKSEPGKVKDTEKQLSDYFNFNTEISNDWDSFGVRSITDLNRNQLLQLDSCVECGRCDDVCPSFLSGKSLSPQKLIKVQKECMNHYESSKDREIISQDGIRESIWNCSMCYACEEACPALVEHVDRIIGLRRNMVLNLGRATKELNKVIRNVDKYGNPFGLNNLDRLNLIKELGIPILKEGQNVEYLLWVGCHGYFDTNMKNALRSLVKILRKAGISFAVMNEESCCGDVVRRAGGEYQFQTVAYKNVELFAKYNIKKILTICPHCFNSLKKDYIDFGCTVRINHYVEVLAELTSFIRQRPIKGGSKRIFYHDSCYLGRLNNLYEAPREMIGRMGDSYSIVSLKNEREDSLCCGGGGGHIWMDHKVDNRPSLIKIEEIKNQNIDVIVTSCPYCLNMFKDGVEFGAAGIQVMELLELVEEYIGE